MRNELVVFIAAGFLVLLAIPQILLAVESTNPTESSEQPGHPGIVDWLCPLGLGFGLGLYGGWLFYAIVCHWENAATAVKAFGATVGILLPVGGGSIVWWLGGKDATSLYVLGLALGLLLAYIRPRQTHGYTLDDVKHIMTMSDHLREIGDVEERAWLILSTMFSPARIRRQENITKQQLARHIENAADAFLRPQSDGSTIPEEEAKEPADDIREGDNETDEQKE